MTGASGVPAPDGGPGTALHTVRIPSVLRSYTSGTSRVEVQGSTAGAILERLDERFPGLRFRMVDEQDRLRPHMKVFIGDEAVRDLHSPVPEGAEVTLMQALSGG